MLQEAWRRVRNRGAAGVERSTLAAVEQYGVERLLQDLGVALKQARIVRAAPAADIPKADGRQRLGIPTVRDRVAQMAATLGLEPDFEADFRASSYGFGRSGARRRHWKRCACTARGGGNHALDADIRDYFDSIDHQRLLVLVSRRVGPRVLKLLRQWLAAGVMEDGQWTRTMAGTSRRGRHLAAALQHLPACPRPGVGRPMRTLARWSATPTTSWSCADTKRQVEEARARVSRVLSASGSSCIRRETRTVATSRADTRGLTSSLSPV